MNIDRKKVIVFLSKCLIKMIVVCAAVYIAAHLVTTVASCGLLLYSHSNNDTVTEVSTVNAPDEQYQVIFQMRGEPAWPFGPVNVLVIVQDADGNIVEEIESSIANDGSPACPENMQVEWKGDMVEIILNGDEQEDEAYQVQLS